MWVGVCGYFAFACTFNRASVWWCIEVKKGNIFSKLRIHFDTEWTWSGNHPSNTLWPGQLKNPRANRAAAACQMIISKVPRWDTSNEMHGWQFSQCQSGSRLLKSLQHQLLFPHFYSYSPHLQMPFLLTYSEENFINSEKGDLSQPHVSP